MGAHITCSKIALVMNHCSMNGERVSAPRRRVDQRVQQGTNENIPLCRTENKCDDRFGGQSS